MTKIPIFELKQVSQQFGQFRALTNLNLKIYPGERVALVGASGAGKSTLIRLLNGILLPSKGEVWVLGRNLARISPRQLRQVQRRLGTVYQQFNLVNNLRVIHNVNAGHLGRWSLMKALVSLLFPQEVDTALKALAQVGIPEKLYAPTEELSGGQQQRVALARVLVQNPDVILADEPISNLDRQMSREIMDLLKEISETGGKTLVTSLHSLEFACSHCDRLVGLQRGQIVFDVPPGVLSQTMIDKLYATETDLINV
ncbi:MULTISPECIES: ATP-binding cassette domain-containing protein [Moorena]|uniref:ABC-type phosphate/phosphonate transport system, ATPase component n=1 Tax=Moorena producens 3L TaxID=489825 RepID=F4XME8_9CYAN|nr:MULTISPECIES: ATP-binding cassette domain-containing protein [Moorena]EGJ33857.1 ABC-type phosphate/phosphonate transport system, ATPase component [Moorena producens 3L]NEP37093.1 ATP-binding cassette domain-containing protein [Moorena sp. SIO3B2]NEP67900.1 ATP-binding cassette domain-containing protein [Moorena sp. SIO3A5]NEQ06582.1 ATP-binding cassette domain-containing protein [Moorena sp. SIO4E2]NES41335.1 ATP-binding cassette domain-containing protein [Moorena sp. SIO2C4]